MYQKVVLKQIELLQHELNLLKQNTGGLTGEGATGEMVNQLMRAITIVMDLNSSFEPSEGIFDERDELLINGFEQLMDLIDELE